MAKKPTPPLSAVLAVLLDFKLATCGPLTLVPLTEKQKAFNLRWANKLQRGGLSQGRQRLCSVDKPRSIARFNPKKAAYCCLGVGTLMCNVSQLWAGGGSSFCMPGVSNEFVAKSVIAGKYRGFFAHVNDRAEWDFKKIAQAIREIVAASPTATA